MATLSDLNRKIAKLQQQANAIKNKERKGIISQIRQAIVDYDLTFEDLFSADGSVVRQGRRPGSGRQVSKISDGINKPRRGRLSDPNRTSLYPFGIVTTKVIPGPGEANNRSGFATSSRQVTTSANSR